MSHRNKFRRSLGTIVVCGLLGLAALAFGISAVVDHLLFMSTAERTVATVAQLKRQTVTYTVKHRNGTKEGKRAVYDHPVVSFTYQGTPYEVTLSGHARTLSQGAQVPIVFQRDNPRDVRFDEPGKVWEMLWGGLFVGLFFLGVGGYTLYDTRFRRTPVPVRTSPPQAPVPAPSAPILGLGAHVPGRWLVLKLAFPRQHLWVAWTAALGLPSAGVAFIVRAPLVGLGLLAVAGVIIGGALRWMTHQVDFTLVGVEVRRGFRRQWFERVGLRGVTLAPDPAPPGGAFRLWLEPRASEQPVEVLHASVIGPRPVVEARLRELQEALEGLDLRVTLRP